MTTSTEPCLSCGTAGPRRVRAYRCESPAGRALFGSAVLVCCPICGFVQMTPIPSRAALENYYAEAYRQGGRHGSGVADAADFPRDNLFYMYRGQSIAALLAPLVPDRLGHDRPRVLDVGAGWGHILHALGERFPGSSRSAVEISQVCVDHLRALGVTVHQSATEDILTGLDQEFDVIILSHVLEHLRDPLGALRLLRQRLSPAGLLYVEVPHIPADSLTRYLDHPWAPRHDEPHLTFFDPATLRGTLERAGFTVVRADTAGPEYRDVSWAAFHLPSPRALALRLIPGGVKRLLRRRRIGAALSVFDHEEPFYRYGGRGIWLRSISTR